MNSKVNIQESSKIQSLYPGQQWCPGKLPHQSQSWPKGGNFRIGPGNDQEDISKAEVDAYTKDKLWLWNGRRVYFFCDIHADTEAFFLSLTASGGVIKTGPGDKDFELTPEGEKALFIIGGDCFDKGPHNLRLLEALHQLYLKGADIELLAGNHDIRTYLGIFYAESKDPLLDHLFVRMGKKTVPLLKEIHDWFIEGQSEQLAIGDEINGLHDILFPSESWYEEFPKLAAEWVAPEKLQKEMIRIREKAREFETTASDSMLNLHQVYQAVRKFRELFFEPAGRYFWFFEKMKLAHREGSYLFLHAGVDDSVAREIHNHGVPQVNTQFKDMLHSNPFELYHGTLGNAFRTKYRDFDYPLTALGVQDLHRSGIFAIVHGHRNICQGQRLVIRAGMLNFECDASVDQNTRAIENLYGPGGAAVVFTEHGIIKGISTDYPFIKVFHPGKMVISCAGNDINHN